MLNSRRKSTATTAKFSAGELRAHVPPLQRLDRIPVEVEFLGDILDGGLATAPPHVVGRALGLERVVRQEVRTLALHGAAPRTARDAPRSPERYVRGHTRDHERTACVGRTSPTGGDNSLHKRFF